jgi:LPXTG-motif cell wall-anchored protein
VYTPSSLILMKVVNGGTSVPEDWTLTARDGDGNTVAEGPGIAGPVQVPSGIYTLSESADFAGSDAYASSGWVCAEQVVAATDDLVVADPGPALLPNQVKIEPGASWVCMVTNTYVPPPPPPPPPAKLTVAVETIGADGTFLFNGQEMITFTSLDALADLSAFSITTTGFVGNKPFADLDPGTYTVTEDLAALGEGWSFVSVSCDDGFEAGAAPVDGSVTVDLPPGSDVTCTFINEYVPEEPAAASLTVKLVTRGGAGTFEFNGDQVGAFILKTLVQAGIIDPEAVTTFADLAPGTYGITEKALPAFWHAVSAACDNGDTPTALTLAEGDAVTCTFVVEKDAPSAQVGDTVFLDQNGNGKQDPGEKGINGAKVFLMDSEGTLIATATTANGGVYLFTGLAAGRYTVKLDAKSVSGELTTAGAFTFDLAEAATYLDADFGLAETLPKTGTDAAALGLLGLMLLAAGAIAVMATRKRREES